MKWLKILKRDKMDFKEVKEQLQENFKEISEDVDHLFEVEVDKDELWNLYLDSFPQGTNEILREKREFDCNNCKSFIRHFGHVVVIKDNEVKSIWDFDPQDSTYTPVMKALSECVHSKPIVNVYLSDEQKVGTDFNYEMKNTEKVAVWHHFFISLPSKFVNYSSKSVDTIKGELKSNRNTFERSLKELTIDSVDTVLELISQNSLYKGEEWKAPLEQFLEYKKDYDTLAMNDDNYVWEKSLEAGVVISKIRNHSIGTLLVNISEGMELDLAVRKYEQIVAPTNYKRPKAIFTAKMLEKAKNTITDLGYIDSLPRRFATLNDMTVNNTLYSNKDSAKRMSGVFEEMAEEIAVDPKRFTRVEEISIKDFIENVLPKARELEVLVENKHTNNLVSLITAQNEDAPSMFKWNNTKSWSYKNNITDSMKERVKSAGGNVEGDLRFSISWNDAEEWDKNDLDAHCKEPSGNLIYYASRVSRGTRGELDVDIQTPAQGQPAVENITWANRRTMEEGVYQFMVHQFSNRGGKGGFRAEIEYDGQIFEFEYNKELKQEETIPVAEITYSKANGFSIKEQIPSSVATRNVWGLKTNNFVPVSVVMYSPNYWDEQTGIGNRHVFFMLKGCVNDEKPNGFYNEFLSNELLEHRKVLEALGSKMAVENVDDQLSGLGFSTTQRNEIYIRVKGQTERVVKVKV
jgi:hypothetical protein